MSIKKIKKNGFTLLEVLISVVIMSFVAIGLIGMQSVFSKSITSRQISTALTDVANTQIAKIRAGVALEPVLYYEMFEKEQTKDSNGNVTSRKFRTTPIYTYLLQANGLPLTTSWTAPTADTCVDLIIRTTDGNVYGTTNITPSTPVLTGNSLKNVLNQSRTFTTQTRICDFS